MKIRDAKSEELVRAAQAKQLSPRQKAAQEPEAKVRKLLGLLALLHPQSVLESQSSEL